MMSAPTVVQRIARRFGYMKATDATSLLVAAIANYGSSTTPEKTYLQLVDAYKSWVYTAIDKIAKSIASCPVGLYTYRRAGKKIAEPWTVKEQLRKVESASERKYALKQLGVERVRVESHPFIDLIGRPNGVMTRFMLWYETLLRMELAGLCGWYMPRNGLGLPGEIWPLPLMKTAILKPRVSAKMEIESWSYTDGTVRRDIAPIELLALKYPNPASPFIGFSPLMAQSYPYDVDLAISQQQKALFDNRAIPGLHMSTEQRLGPDQVKELQELINDKFAGALKAGKTLITHSGLTAEMLGQSAKDTMVTEVAKWAREKLITSYDLSEGKLGLVSDVNRANMDALDRTFVRECMRPKTMLVEEAIETFLLVRYDQGLALDFELPDTEDREAARSERETNLKNFVTVVNEERAKLGLDPVPWGDRPWIPLGITQDPMTVVPSEPAPAASAEGGEVKGAPMAHGLRRWQLFVSRTAPWEHLVAAQMKGYFKHQGEEVVKRLHRLGPRYESQYAGWSRKAVAKHIAEKGIGDDINIDPASEIARLRMLFTPAITTMVEGAGARRLQELGIGVMFNVGDPKTAKWIGSRMAQFSEEVTGTTFAEIRAALREGFSQGQPLSTIADTLREIFDRYEKYRAPLIARTEVVAASNKADLLAIRQSGVAEQLVKGWLTAGDEHVRESHAEAGARYAEGIPIDEDFVVGGDSMDAPGNGSDPGENVQCRCTVDYRRAD